MIKVPYVNRTITVIPSVLDALIRREGEWKRSSRGCCKLLPLGACTKLRDQDHAGRELALSQNALDTMSRVSAEQLHSVLRPSTCYMFDDAVLD